MRPTPRRRARDNPFRRARLEALSFRMTDTEPNRLLDRWAEHGHRGALVGPKGSGKTTLLETLERYLIDRGWSAQRFRFTVEQRRWPAPYGPHRGRLGGDVGRRVLASIDGFEQLPPWSAWSLRWHLRSFDGILLTSHRPSPYPTLYQHATTLALLDDLVRELVPDVDETVLQQLPALFDQHAGNLRECLRQLYDQWAVEAW